MLTAGESHPLVVLALLHKHYRQMLRLDGSGVTSAEQAAEVLGMKSAFPAKKALAQANRLGIGPDRPGRAAAGPGRPRPAGHAPACRASWCVEVLVARLSRLGAAPLTGRGGRRRLSR